VRRIIDNTLISRSLSFSLKEHYPALTSKSPRSTNEIGNTLIGEKTYAHREECCQNISITFLLIDKEWKAHVHITMLVEK